MEIVTEVVSKMSENYSTWRNTSLMILTEVAKSNLIKKVTLALHTTVTALMMWLEVFYIIAEPLIRWWWQWQCNLSTQGLYIELGIFLGLFLLYFLRRWLRKKQFLKRIKNYVKKVKRSTKDRYRRLVSDIEKKSKIVALAFPHVMFFGVSIFLCRVFPAWADWLTSDAMIEQLVILVRVAFTCFAIYDGERANIPVPSTPVTTPAAKRSWLSVLTPSRSTPSTSRGLVTVPNTPNTPQTPSTNPTTQRDRALNSVRTNLMHWIVFAVFICVQRVASLLPLIGSVGRLVGADHRLRLFYALLLLWLQLPIGAVEVAYNRLVPLLEHHAPVLFSPSARTSRVTDDTQARVQQLGGVLRLATLSGMVSAERADTIRELCSDGWVLLGSVFFFTPMFTQYGILLCGLLYPAACSALLVTDQALHALPSQIRWLKYWCVYAMVLHFGHELESSGLWYFMFGANYFHLALVIYLQLPYFRGATRIYSFVIKLVSYFFVILLDSNGGGGSGDGSQHLLSTSNRGSDVTTPDSIHRHDNDDVGNGREINSCSEPTPEPQLKQRKKHNKVGDKTDSDQKTSISNRISTKEDFIPSAAAAIQAEIMDDNDQKKKKKND